MSALSRLDRPCYTGQDYGHQEYIKLAELLKEPVVLSLQTVISLLFIDPVWLHVSLHTEELQRRAGAV